MFSPLIIAAFVALVLHDELGGAMWRQMFSNAEATRLTLVGFSSLATSAMIFVGWCAHRIDRRGSIRAARSADRAVRLVRVLAAVLFLTAVLGIGWLDAVRSWTGDVVGLDELIALSPLIGVYLAAWWAFYPVERRLREAMVLRTLDEGGPMYPIPSRLAYVAMMFRQQMGFVLAPMLILMSIGELSPRAVRWFGVSEDRGDLFSALSFAGQATGVLIMMLLMPLVMRVVWDTVPIGPGPLGDRLRAMCVRHRLGVRRMLLWRTGGMVLNGAVVGLIPGLRYILLTDALVDRLSEREIEAVAAHEAAHVLKRHMIWLVVALVASILAGGIIAQELVIRLSDLHPGVGMGAGLVLVGSLACAWIGFGVVSRRFERQADTFAAGEMSAALAASEANTPPRFSEAGVESMVAALRHVSAFNGTPVERFGWRHGSIAQRIESLRALVGVPIAASRPDRDARRVKWASLGLLACALLASALLPAG
jgi:STE24 endopeptidase